MSSASSTEISPGIATGSRSITSATEIAPIWSIRVCTDAERAWLSIITPISASQMLPKWSIESVSADERSAMKK